MERVHEDGPAKRSTSPALAMALTLGYSPNESSTDESGLTLSIFLLYLL